MIKILTSYLFGILTVFSLFIFFGIWPPIDDRIYPIIPLEEYQDLGLVLLDSRGDVQTNFKDDWELSQMIVEEVKAVAHKTQSQTPLMAVMTIQRDFEEGKIAPLEDEKEYTDFWQTYEETSIRGGGDCEDLTTWILIELINRGFDPKNLGFQIWWDGTENGHAEALLWFKEFPYIFEGEELRDAKEQIETTESKFKEILIVRGLGEEYHTTIRFGEKRITPTIYEEFTK